MNGHPGGAEHTRRMLALAELPAGARVLDMGAGAGEAVAVLSSLGYRAEEHFNVKPLYAFGYGLTYSTFDYSDIRAVPAGDGYDIIFTVANTGKTAAKEVAQVYVAPVNPSIIRPAKELKGYDKKLIAKGAAAEYTIHLGPDAFSYYDVDNHSWKLDRGEYSILVGASADDIRLEVKVNI